MSAKAARNKPNQRKLQHQEPALKAASQRSYQKRIEAAIAAEARKVDSRQRRLEEYRKHRSFEDELCMIKALLKQQTNFEKEILRFLRRFQWARLNLNDVDQMLVGLPRNVRELLWRYVDFSLRFRVRLKPERKPGGDLDFSVYCDEISPDFMTARLVGKLMSPLADGVRYGDDFEDYREGLRQEQAPEFARALAAGKFRFLELRIPASKRRPAQAAQRQRSTVSETAHLLDTFYDPLRLNFVVVRQAVRRGQSQSYLLCLVGELTSADDWKSGGTVKTALHKAVYGISTRGRPTKPASRKLAELLLKNDLHPKGAAIDASMVGGKVSGDARTDKVNTQRAARLLAKLKPAVKRKSASCKAPRIDPSPLAN